MLLIRWEYLLDSPQNKCQTIRAIDQKLSNSSIWTNVNGVITVETHNLVWYEIDWLLASVYHFIQI